jgi:hypothetical protein
MIENTLEETKSQAATSLPVASKKATDFMSYREKFTVPKDKKRLLLGSTGTGETVLSAIMRKTSMSAFRLPLTPGRHEHLGPSSQREK